ncbi:MAG: branched-chain amino acid ABC transporter substrate-binding protein [Anaerolineae bacterium]
MAQFRRWMVVLTLLLFLALLAGCGGAPRYKGEVVVYVAAPLSGFQANGGQTVVGGARLRAHEINQKGGLLGYRVQIIGMDDESDSDVAVEVAQTIKEAVLAGGQRVIGVLGHYNSGQTLAAMEVYKDLPLVVITPMSSNVALTQKGYTRFFRVIGTDEAQGRVDAEFLVNHLGARRIAVVHADNEYARGLRDEIVKSLRALGQEPVLIVEIQEAADTQMPAVQKVKAANPDAVFLAGYETEGYIFVPELREAGVEVPVLASDGCFLAAYIDESRGLAEGTYVSAFTPSHKVVTDEAWVKAYQEVEYRNPDTYSIAGYAAMQVLEAGVVKAGTFDADRVAEAIRTVTVDTPAGRMEYDARGDLREQRIFIFQVRESEFVQVYP